jgi:cyclopropane fatty-acyl-phospholipid synthase-like methyltransferase
MALGTLDIRRLFSLPAVYDGFQDIVGANALKKRFLETYLPSERPLRVLEIGCGPGKNLDYLPRDIEYVGCDLSSKYIEHAKKKYGHLADFYCMSVADLSKLNIEPFDVVISMGVLHHLSDDLVRAFCQETTLVLKKNGLFLAQEPCWTDSQSWINRKIMSYDRGDDIRYMDGYCDLLKSTFREATASEVETRDVIIFPTAACVIKASGSIDG